VFASTTGTPIGISNSPKELGRPLLKRAGLPHARVHDLRLTAATFMLSRGVPVKVVSEMLGHADVSTTLSIYAHVLPDMQGGVASAMDDLLG
jgi:integrase